jgi:hypothetical protein
VDPRGGGNVNTSEICIEILSPFALNKLAVPVPVRGKVVVGTVSL